MSSTVYTGEERFRDLIERSSFVSSHIAFRAENQRESDFYNICNYTYCFPSVFLGVQVPLKARLLVFFSRLNKGGLLEV